MNELIIAYKDLDIIDKRRELAEEFIEFLGVIKKLRDDMEITEPINLVLVKKLYDTSSSEEEYLTAIYENVLNVKEELSVYLNNIVDLLYEENKD